MYKRQRTTKFNDDIAKAVIEIQWKASNGLNIPALALVSIILFQTK